MTVHDTLRPACRSRRIDTVYNILRTVHRLRVFRHTLPGSAFRKVYHRYFRTGHCHFGMVYQYCLRCTILQHETDPFLRIEWVHRNICSSCLDDAVNSLDHLKTPFRQDGNKIIRSHAERSQPVGQYICFFIQFPIGAFFFPEHESSPVRCLFCLLLNYFSHRLILRVPGFCVVERAKDQTLFLCRGCFDITQQYLFLLCHLFKYRMIMVEHPLHTLFPEQVTAVFQRSQVFPLLLPYIKGQIEFCNHMLL